MKIGEELCIKFLIIWRCVDGIVACAGGPIKCRYYQGETTKRPPNGCSFEDNYRYNGEVFLATDECNICLCQNGEVECVVKRECSDLTKTPRKLDVNYWRQTFVMVALALTSRSLLHHQHLYEMESQCTKIHTWNDIFDFIIFGSKIYWKYDKNVHTA